MSTATATMIELHLVVGAQAPASRRAELAEVGRALAAAGLGSVVVAAADRATGPDAVRLVWAGELAEALAAVAEPERERWLDSTILVNEERARVLELLEERGLLGAVEYADAAEWSAAEGPRLFVRKDVVRQRGEPTGAAAPPESDAYTLWSDPDSGSLAAALARYLAHWREVDAEMVVTAEEARARRLPAVELRLRLGGTGLFRMPPAQSPGYYLVLSSAPGGGAGFAARPDQGPAGEGLEQAARRMLQNPRGPELVAAGGLEPVHLAGAERESICLFADWLRFRTASCMVRVEHARGALMAIFICSIGSTEPSSRIVLADPGLRRIARTLRVSDAEPGSGD